jgi:hypothetical protein
MAADNTIDLIINQKASFQVSFTVKETSGNTTPTILDLSGYSVAAKYKTDFETPDSQAVAFTSSVTNAAAGAVSISLSANQTANLQLQRYVYDVTITDGSTGFKTRIVQGNIKVSGGVS